MYICMCVCVSERSWFVANVASEIDLICFKTCYPFRTLTSTNSSRRRRYNAELRNLLEAFLHLQVPPNACLPTRVLREAQY